MSLNNSKILSLIIPVFCILLSLYWINEEKGVFNSDNYLSHAYNISINKIYSGESSYSGFYGETEDIKPTWRRAPAWPYVAATIFLLTSQENNLVQCFEQLKSQNCENLFSIVKFTNALLFIICILFLYKTCMLCGKNYLLSLCVSLVSALILSKEMVISSHSEPLAIMCYSAFCYFLFRSIFDLKPSYFVSFVGAIFLSILVLSRSVYLYYIPFLIFIFVFLIITRNKFVFGKAKSACLFIGLIVLIISPWLTRNYYHFGQFDIANSGAVQVLSIRYEHNQMKRDEYMSGFIYWVPIPIYGKKIQNFFQLSNIERFKVDNQDGFRQVGYRKGANLVKQIGYENAKRYYLTRILSKPLKNIQMSLLFAWRGIHYAIIFFPFFLVLIYLSIRRYNYNHFILLFSLSIFNVCFHSFITHFNIRYGYPLVVGFAPAICLLYLILKRSKA